MARRSMCAMRSSTTAIVVEGLEKRGAIFVDELDQVPDGAPVVFSAHGVPKSVPAEATRRQLLYLDATCPLVSKVHREAERHFAAGHQILLIGHAHHPEVIGTMGQLPAGAVVLVETVAAAEAIEVADPSQPRLYHPDHALGRRHGGHRRRAAPALSRISRGRSKDDICYATTNRQQAVKAIAQRCDALLVLGAPNSSNSMRLVEVALGGRLPRCLPRAPRGGDRLEPPRGRRPASASPPAPRRRRSWWRR